MLQYCLSIMTSHPTEYSNIIHLSIGDNVNIYGKRCPAVYFTSGSTKLHVCSAINGNGNKCWRSRFKLPLNAFSKIQIQQ